MAKSQEAPMPQIPRNLRNYGISEPWAESAPPLAYRVNDVGKEAFLHWNGRPTAKADRRIK